MEGAHLSLGAHEVVGCAGTEKGWSWLLGEFGVWTAVVALDGTPMMQMT